MAWIWYVVLFIAGACVGAVLMGVLAFDNVKRRDDDE